MDNINNIWEEYGKSKDPILKEKLILKYASLVKYVAGRLSIHFGDHVELDELVSYGIFGLIDAIDKFKYEKGVKFETYASLRIRGSIIDGIRKLDWIPRTLREKNKLLEQASNELIFELGRDPTDNELAKKLDISVNEVRQLMKKTSLMSVISLDEYLEQNQESFYPGDYNESIEDPVLQHERNEIKELLVNAINNLSEKEKLVVTLYYFEELTLKEISKIMSVSESRVSQIHTKALSRLQTKLGKYRYILYAI